MAQFLYSLQFIYSEFEMIVGFWKLRKNIRNAIDTPNGIDAL